MDTSNRHLRGHSGTWLYDLHRFLKVNDEDEMMIDVLVAKDEGVRR